MNRNSVKLFINEIIKKSIPQHTYLKMINWKRGLIEPELKLVSILCDKNKISIDVGASDGLYTTYMYLYSEQCYAFEPRSSSRDKLKMIFEGFTPPLILESAALSDHRGTANLKIFLEETGRSTIEPENNIENFGKIETIRVNVKKLDDYNFSNDVSLIKIDVEGHEEAVLKGAEKLLRKDHPSLIIEIENRHKNNSVTNINNFLRSLDYDGFFMRGNKLHRMEEFDPIKDQDIKNINKHEYYINNFIFLTKQNFYKIKQLL